jgi:hypothetical protein
MPFTFVWHVLTCRLFLGKCRQASPATVPKKVTGDDGLAEPRDHSDSLDSHLEFAGNLPRVGGLCFFSARGMQDFLWYV